jgi:hypothetical protein
MNTPLSESNQIVKTVKRIIVLSLLLSGALAIFIFSSIPSWWVYNHVAVRKAFGSAAPLGVKVQEIKKPYTVTFSNGTTADVGPLPANLSNLAHLGLGIPAALAYAYLIYRRGPQWFRSGKWMRPGVSITED